MKISRENLQVRDTLLKQKYAWWIKKSIVRESKATFWDKKRNNFSYRRKFLLENRKL